MFDFNVKHYFFDESRGLKKKIYRKNSFFL